MERYIGKMLDNRYEILEVIGQGGMAVVFKAKCHRLNRLVAIKVLKPELAGDAEFRRRFHDESQAVAMLSHPNIVSVYDVSRGGDLEYIVMELIDGITLKQYMSRRGQLNWREALHFITQVMRALGHAHSRGIIHRDIKPQNIMILRDGSVKVADFGIAFLTAKNTQTLAGKEALGSVHYISPEQAKGDRLDARSDIYSAGVVMYEMMTGRLPFEGDSPVSIAIQHFSAVPLNPREVNADIPEALELICLKAMAPQVERRYLNADEMTRDLEEFRKNPEINFDYDMTELRGETHLDDPTMPINSNQLHGFGVHKERRSYTEEEQERAPVWRTALIIGVAVIFSFFVVRGLYNVILKSFDGSDSVTQYMVPNVVGMTVEEAEQDEQVAGKFEINVIAQKYSDEYEQGEIMSQSPSAETTKKSDFVIDVTISKGVQSAELVSLVDYERTAAKLVLEKMNLGLDIQYEEKHSNSVPAGTVIATEPQAGTMLSVGDTVVVTVSLGPEIKPVTVISFLDMTREQAEAAARKLGLVPTFREVEIDGVAGLVIGQSIEPSTQVNEGAVIELRISRATQYDPEGVMPIEPEEPDIFGAGTAG